MPIFQKRDPHRPSRRLRIAHPQQPHRVRETSMRGLVEDPPDEHDLACLTRAMDAGAHGDAEASLAHELAGAIVLESPHRFILQDLIDQGEHAPAWAYSRWCADLAYRSMLLEQDPRTEVAVRWVLAALYPGSVAEVLDDPVGLRTLGTSAAAGDWLVRDLAVYEFGGLAKYVAECAGPGLLERTDHVRDWADAEMRSYEFTGFRGCRLLLRDLVDGAAVEALNIGAVSGTHDDGPAGAPAKYRGDEAAESFAGVHLVGRLVPIASEPGLMFAIRPTCVDMDTARAVAEAVRTSGSLAWLGALSTAVLDGSCEEGFHRTASTLYTSDLPMPEIVIDDATHVEKEEAGRIVELRGKGYSAEVANALAVLELGLISSGVSDEAAAVVSPHVAAAMGTPGAFEAAMAECTSADTADAWRILAATVPEHLVERCRTLAGRADSAAEGTAPTDRRPESTP